MLMLKLASAFALMGATLALNLDDADLPRPLCLSNNVDKGRQRSRDADAVICYHGKYDVENKSGDTFGILSQTPCGNRDKVSVDCFWMNAPAFFMAYDDGGSDNLAYSIDTNKCKYDSYWRTINCGGN
ncbi:uncharacterized protein PAN0_003c1910 [Moesziomyces antarcticus]|uniref:DUF7888 domain-containing protein n=1 Tax=Pseudozyma antarctica TaxID=84753 RepID=A0A5C3FJD2_PSEA2|nr:uncharacterized protein PAN0_003c1910 [Moesziomyces antarcticus]GAK63703.1 hypothetical protein PAN0_003c1910 [Moesziomyces antarcticus]SPO44300.1 uncharacterized protein PSANT_01985 [Moesziomyces antarcticus]